MDKHHRTLELDRVLEMLAEEGEEKTFRFIKEELVQHKRCMDWHQLEKAE